MNMKWNRVLGTGAIAALMLCGSGMAVAQSGQGQPAQQQSDKDKAPASTPLSLDAAAAPVNAEEDAAYKAYDAIPASEPEKRIQAGEAFVQKYPQSRYLSPLYAGLVVAYVQLGQVDKMEATGDKAIVLNPNDVQTLAILGSSLPRAINASTPEPGKKLDKAEQYAKRAIEVMPTIPKPANLTDEIFEKGKNQTLALAHSGLGVIYFRRGKFAEATTELEQSIKIDLNPDPVNYFLLGICDEKTSHFDDAAAAFAKCAGIPGGMQATCKNGVEEAKKLAATQLSAPK